MSQAFRPPRLEPRFRSLYIGLLTNAVLFGAIFTVVGAVLPEMIRSLRWNYNQVGVVLAAGSIGYFASTFSNGFAVRWIGPRAVVVIGLIFAAGGLAFYGATPSVLINATLSAVIGIGNGAVEVVLNYGGVRVERDGHSQLMNLLHAAVSAGSVAGPLLAARLLQSGMAWQIAYRVLALCAVSVAVWLALLPFSRLEDGLAAGRSGAAARRLDTGLLVTCVAILMFYLGVEVGVSSWISEYFVGFLSSTAAQGALLVSLFWIGVLSGRLLFALFYRSTRAAEAVLVLAIVAVAGLVLAITTAEHRLAAIGFIATGFGFSSIYPLVMSLIGRNFAAHHQSMAIGFASTGGGVGAFAFPLVMATLAQRLGIRRGFLLYIVLSAVLVGLAVGAVIKIRATSRAPAA